MVLSYSKWPDLLLREKLMNLRCLESLLLSPLLWLCLSLESFHQFHLANPLYHLHCGCKLLRITWSIIDRKLMNLRRLELLLLLPPPWLRLLCHLFYQFYHLFISSIIRKFLRMTWYIVDRKTDEFRTSGVLVDLAVARCCCLSRCLWLCLGCLLLCLCLLCAWVYSSIYICLCLCLVCRLLRRCDCKCGWVVCSSVCVCCVPESVLPSASASAMFVPVPMPSLLAPPSLWLWVWLGRPLFCLCLLCAWVCSSVCVCIYCICDCAWFVYSSVALFVAVPGSSALLSMSAVCLGSFIRLRLHLLYVCTCAWFVSSSICICCVFGFAKSVKKRANQYSIPRFTR